MFGGVARVLNAHLPDLEGHVTDLTGRALEWHSRGQRFDPAYLHQKDLKSKDFRSFLFLFDNLIVGMFRLLTQQAAEAYPKFVFCEIGTFPDSSILRISFLSSVNFKPPFS